MLVIEPYSALFPFYILLMARSFMSGSLGAPPCALRKALTRSGSPSALKGTCVGELPAFGLVVGTYGSWSSSGLGAAVNVSTHALPSIAADPFGRCPHGTAAMNYSALRPSLRSVRARSLDFVANYIKFTLVVGCYY